MSVRLQANGADPTLHRMLSVRNSRATMPLPRPFRPRGTAGRGTHAGADPGKPSRFLHRHRTLVARVRPALEFEFQVRAALGAPIEQGVWEDRRRRIIPILGGAVEGARFSGLVLPGGADWQTISLADGAAQILARYTLRHDDGTIVSVVNPGVRTGSPEVLARLANGEEVDPASYHFRTSPQFEVGPGPHHWLARNTFVGVGKRWPDAVAIDVYRVT